MNNNEPEPDWIEALLVVLLSISFALGIFAAFLPSSSYGAVRAGTLCWDAPTTRMDGSPLSADDLAGYEVAYDESTHAVSGTEFDFTIERYGSTCFSVRAVDADGLYSQWSEPVCVTVNAPPAAVKFRECEE